MKVKIEYENHEIKKFKKVKIVREEKEVNELLMQGYELLHTGASHLGDNGFCAKPLFILGTKEDC